MALHWIALSVFVVAALAFDLRSSARAAPSVRSAAIWSVVWTLAGAAFGAILLLVDGATQAGQYLSGFLIEKSLSLDNLFVFAVLFGFFSVPEAQRQRVLVLGIAGAIVLRTLFILLGAAALQNFEWFTYVLGALLAYTAFRIARQGSEEIDPDQTNAMRVLRRVVPLAQGFDGGRLLTREGGRRKATPLLAAFLMVAAFDVMFAVDSIPAIFAITQDTFVVFAANAFSLLGMVSLFFLLDELLARFRYLNLGLAVILGYVAAKLLLADVWHAPEWLSLVVIAVTLAVAALASRFKEQRDDVRRPGDGAAEGSPAAPARRTG